MTAQTLENANRIQLRLSELKDQLKGWENGTAFWSDTIRLHKTHDNGNTLSYYVNPDYIDFDRLKENTVEYLKALKEDDGNFHFWALENPVGRLERLVPEIKPYRKLAFDPADYGDPYTKKTILYGEFNHKLPKTPVLPLYGSMMNLVPGSKKQAEIRSATPRGFAQAFFKANQ